MTSRKRAGLDLGGFEPKAPERTTRPDVAAAIARDEGFVSRAKERTARRARKQVRLPIDVPEEVRAWLKDEAHRRDVTVRAVLLLGLKAMGAPVEDEDLVDRRRLY